MPDIIGETIDRLTTVEMRNRAMNHNIIRGIYDEARREGGGRPIVARAAEALSAAVQPGDRVLIVTGAGYAPEAPNGESDGPPGAAALAYTLFWGLQAVPVYVCEPCHAPPVSASSQAAGIMVRPYELARDRRMGAAIAESPLQQGAVQDWAAEVFDRYQPTAIVAIERLGPNEQGFLHYSTGVRPKECVDLAPLFAEAARRKVLSIGIGDNGNEIGFGRIFDFMKTFHPYGQRCQYEGGVGVPTTVATDIFMPASISNWGAYGLSAMLAFLRRDLQALHSPAIAGDVIRACLNAGGWEMRYCTSRFIVDGTEGESSMSMVQLLRDMVRVNIAPLDRGLSHGRIDR